MVRSRLMMSMLLAAAATAVAVQDADAGHCQKEKAKTEEKACKQEPQRAPEAPFSAQRTATFDGQHPELSWHLTGLPTRGDTLSPVSRLHVVLKNLDPRFDYSLSIGEVEFDPQENRPFEFDSSVVDLVFPAEEREDPEAMVVAETSGARTRAEVLLAEVEDALATARVDAQEKCSKELDALAKSLSPLLTSERWDAKRFRSFVANYSPINSCSVASTLGVDAIREALQVTATFEDAERDAVAEALGAKLGLEDSRPLSMQGDDLFETAQRIAEAHRPSAELAELRAVRGLLDAIINTLSARNEHRHWEQDFGPWKANRIVTPRVVYRRTVPAFASGEALVSHLAAQVRLAEAEAQRDAALQGVADASSTAASALETLAKEANSLLDMLRGAESASANTVAGGKDDWTKAATAGEALAQAGEKASAKMSPATDRTTALDAALSSTEAIAKSLAKLEAAFQAPDPDKDGDNIKAARAEVQAALSEAKTAVDKAKASVASAKTLQTEVTELTEGNDDTIDPGEAGQVETSLYVVRARVLRAEAGLTISLLDNPDYAFENGLIVNNGRRFQVHGTLFFGHYWAPRAFHRPMRDWERFVPTVRVGVSITDKVWENIFLGLAWEPVRDLVFGFGAHIASIQGLPDGLAVGDARPTGFADGAGVPNQAKAGVAPFFSISIEGSLLPRLFAGSTPPKPKPIDDGDADTDDDADIDDETDNDTEAS